MLTPATIKTWYIIHKWTSLICTVFLLLLCLTGLPLIFHHEIDHVLGDAVEPPAMPADTPRVSLDRIVTTAKERRPNDFIQFVSQPADEPDAWFVRMGETPTAQEASAAFMFDARTMYSRTSQVSLLVGITLTGTTTACVALTLRSRRFGMGFVAIMEKMSNCSGSNASR